MASRRKNASVYENSTTIAVNLVRASSQITLGRGHDNAPVPPAAPPPPALAPPARPVAEMWQMVEPAERRTTTYVMEPDTGGAATATVDESADRLIKRIREKLRAQNYSDPAPLLKSPTPDSPIIQINQATGSQRKSTMASRRKNASVYENSTTFAVNLVRASSLALAQITLGSGSGGAPVPPAASPPPALAPQARPVAKMRQMVEPAERRTDTYVMEPEDKLAEIFIKTFHETPRTQNYSGPVAHFTPPPPVRKSAARFTA